MSRFWEGVKRAGKEIDAEVWHQGGRGASELANAIFSGNAFVLYGHGQQPQNANQLGTEAGNPSPEVNEPKITQAKGMSM